MPSVSYQIGVAIIAKLNTVTGIDARWFGAEDGFVAGVAYLVLSGNQLTERTSFGGGVYRTLSGHVGITHEADVDTGEVTTAGRLDADEVVASVEQALLEIERDGIGVGGEPEFSFLGTQYGNAGETGGIFDSRLEWQARYRHAATNPRTLT